MQAQKSVQLVSVRFIALAFSLLAALLLASAAGYVIRGGGLSAGKPLTTPPTVHFLQLTDSQWQHQRDLGPSPILTSPFGVGH
jgi:hypothetical protein